MTANPSNAARDTAPTVYHPKPGGRGIALSIRQFSLWYGATQALYENTFDIEEGLVTALIGPSGCGKSTLLQTLAGLIAPAAGQLQLNCAVQYLDQHFSLLNSSQSALANLRRHCPLLSETTARTLLASAGLRADKALKPAVEF